MLLFPNCSVVHLCMCSTCLTAENIKFWLHWNEHEKDKKKKDQLLSFNWWYFFFFFLKTTFYSWETKSLAEFVLKCTSLASGPTVLPQWTLGTSIYSLPDNDREEAVSVCDTWSACYGNHSSTHINTHLVSSRCLIGSTPETHTCLNCLCLLLGHLTRWRADFIQIVCVCLSPFSWMHRLAVYEENHLTVSLISQPPPGLNTLAAQHMVAIC